MKPIKQLQFLNSYFDEASKVLVDEWRDGNEDMSEEELRETILEVANIIRSYSPVYYVADESNRKLAFDVDIQDWIAMTLAEACAEIGLKVYALIMPEDWVANLSTEQTVEEAGELPFEVKYFNDKKEALAWIRVQGK